jgi:hypothetical protein
MVRRKAVATTFWTKKATAIVFLFKNEAQLAARTVKAPGSLRAT